MPNHTTIHVKLLDEGVDVWRPVKAIQERDNIYIIEGPIPIDEKWEFAPGDRVRCAHRQFGDERRLSAIDKAP